jgi:hypothetical protein
MRMLFACLLALPVAWYGLTPIAAYLDSSGAAAPANAVPHLLAMLLALYIVSVLVLRKLINWLTR